MKNAFVFAGVCFAHELANAAALGSAVLAFVAFCLTASGIYVFNDYVDREQDRLHPRKRLRPLASGAIAPAEAIVAGAACIGVGLVAAWSAGSQVLIVLLAYVALNSAYSLRLKQLAVVDVFCIAAGFMMRIFAGTWGIGIPPSRWLLLTGMFITLFLAFGKRRAEWQQNAGNSAGRSSLRDYSAQMLDTFLSITAIGTVISYGLYTVDPATVKLHGTGRLVYTVPLVLFGLFRYLLLLHNSNRGEDPSNDVFTDRQLLLCGAAFVGATMWVIGQ